MESSLCQPFDQLPSIVSQTFFLQRFTRVLHVYKHMGHLQVVSRRSRLLLES